MKKSPPQRGRSMPNSNGVSLGAWLMPVSPVPDPGDRPPSGAGLLVAIVAGQQTFVSDRKWPVARVRSRSRLHPPGVTPPDSRFGGCRADLFRSHSVPKFPMRRRPRRRDSQRAQGSQPAPKGRKARAISTKIVGQRPSPERNLSRRNSRLLDVQFAGAYSA
jgi:hypothetical protein